MTEDEIRALYHKHNLADAGLVVSDLKLIVSDVEAAERARQAAEVQRLRADAERYRWLRAQRESHEMNQTQDAMWTYSTPAAEVDAAIGASRRSGRTQQPPEPQP